MELLSTRVLGHQHPEFADKLSVTAEQQVSFDAVLERGQARLFEEDHPRLDKWLMRKVSERWTAP